MAGDRVYNICFHGIGTPWRGLAPGEGVYWVETSRFLQILDEISRWPSLQISFDDANQSDVLIALPALLDRGLRAQFFVVAGRLGADTFLDVDGVRELSAKGMSIGTHGMSHRPWVGMTSAIREIELVEARRQVEDAVGAPVSEAACPMGRYDRRVLADLRRLGYQRVYTSDRAVAWRDRWLQPRFSVRREDTAESLRAAVLTRPSAAERMWRSTKGMAKQLR